MRTAVVLALLGVLGAGCSADGGDRAPAPPSTPVGCGMVPPARVAGVLGDEVHATAEGTLSALRTRHSRAVCRNTVAGNSARYVTVVAEYHPAPVPLPAKSCSAGWVYAGTPDKFTPACQESVDGHGRTQLIVRWQPYLMHVTIGRTDQSWGGDPEVALAMSRAVAQHLGVKEASGDG